MLNLSNNSIEKNIETDRLYAIKLVNSSQKSKLISKWIAFIFLSFFASFLLPWQQSVDGKGKVTAFSPQERPQTIQSMIVGRIEKWYVQEGQFVKKGDTIVKITEIKEKFLDPKLRERMQGQIDAKEQSINAKKMKADALSNQIKALQMSRKLSLSKALNKVQQNQLYVKIDSLELQAAKADLDIAKSQYERQQKLFDDGLVSLTNLEQRKLKFQQSSAKFQSAQNKYNAEITDFTNSRIELNSIEAEYADKLAKAEGDRDATLSDYFDGSAGILKQRSDLSGIELRNDLYIIRAPQDGIMVRAKKQGLGETVKEGEEIATIMPDKSHLAVELYIRPMDVPLIHKGCKVRLQFDGWPAIVFSGWPGASVGTYGATAEVIDFINSDNGKVRILLSPDEKDHAWPEELRQGTGVRGWAMLNNVMLGYELWRQFNGFPADFLTEFSPQKDKDKAKKQEKEDE